MFRSYIFLLFILFIKLIQTEDDFYCRQTDDYRICRKCPSLEEDCERPSDNECRCDNIEIASVTDKELQGGSNCESKFRGVPWCYVGLYSKCTDKKVSKVANSAPNLYQTNLVYFSELACENGHTPDGNELVLPGFRITDSKSQAKVEAESPELCLTACFERPGSCGAWTFDNDQCTLHSLDSCCGQFVKSLLDSSAISGYQCKCWSTKGDCPCSYSKGENAFTSDGIVTNLTTSTGLVTASVRRCQVRQFSWTFNRRLRRWIRTSNAPKKSTSELPFCN